MRVIKLTLVVLLVMSAFAAAGELNFSEFQYITNYEETVFGERIRFFSGDTLYGWIHSNDQIAIMGSPVFIGPITTAAASFWQGPGYNPYLTDEPVFNYSTAEFPEELTSIRDAASEQGRFCALTGYQFRLIFQGSNGCRVNRWPVGLPYSDSLAEFHVAYPPLEDGAIFFDSDLQVLCTDPQNQNDYGINGRYSVGASGNIWIMDNLRYVDSDMVTGQVDSSTTNCLGLASEQNILIANTWENGRDNGSSNPSSWEKDVILNGAFLSLGESFSFEDQNDIMELSGYVPEWYISNGSSPDERGQIHLWGALAQFRRGYVHRSNHGGTGYLKDYHYYDGIRENPPPYFPALEITLDFEEGSFDYGTVGPGIHEMSMEMYNWSMDTIEVYGINASHPAFTVSMVPADTILPNDTALVTLTFEPDSNGYYEESVDIITNYEGDYNIPVYAQVEGLSVGQGPGIVIPSGLSLLRSYPNPFNSEVTVEFVNPGAGMVEFSVYDLEGRAVYFDAGEYAPGGGTFRWYADNVSSGLYFFRIKSGSEEVSGKVLYLR
ncbi:MAG: T9SS type A sorting domain-containing protein [FCB group bacterium]|nr:T9SS type A sorting domain-containing protein [FCB group bacterium]